MKHPSPTTSIPKGFDRRSLHKPQVVFKALQEQMASYVDVISVPIKDCGEPLVPLHETLYLRYFQKDPNMDPYVGNRIFVRQGVANALYSASERIGKRHPTICLKVVYGYRSLKIQTEEFEAIKKQLLNAGFEGTQEALLAAAHLRVAEPSVGGHVAGAAVDVELVDRATDLPLNFGTAISDLSQNSYEYSPFVNEEAQLIRTMLTEAMKSAGFSGFLGEWWHFMLGDREDAWTKHQPYAIYSSVDFKDPEALTHQVYRPHETYKPFSSQLTRIN